MDKGIFYLPVFSFVAITASSGPGMGKDPNPPKGNKTPMDIIAGDGGCVPYDVCSPLFTGDTSKDPSCSGAAVPPNNRSFWNEMGTSCTDLLLVGKDCLLGTDNDIEIRRVGFTVWPDNKIYDKVTIQFDLSGVWEEGGFITDRIDAWGTPNSKGFTISVCKSYIEVKQRQRGRKKIVGWISVGEIQYEPSQNKRS